MNFQSVPPGFGTSVIVILLGNDNDPDGVPRTITVKNRPGAGTLNLSNGPLVTVGDVPTSKVDISIVKGRSCFASLSATFKAGAKKTKDYAFRLARNEAGGSETFSFPGGVSAG